MPGRSKMERHHQHHHSSGACDGGRRSRDASLSWVIAGVLAHIVVAPCRLQQIYPGGSGVYGQVWCWVCWRFAIFRTTSIPLRSGVTSLSFIPDRLPQKATFYLLQLRTKSKSTGH